MDKVQISNARIYKIFSDDPNCIPYIGYTYGRASLEELFNARLNHYRKWKITKYGTSEFLIVFEKCGEENCKIELIEECPFQSLKLLLMRTQEYMDNIICCNKVFAYKAPNEIYKSHEEKQKAKLQNNTNFEEIEFTKFLYLD